MSEERIDELEKELAEAKKERDSAIAELAQFHEAMEREKKPDWEKWLKDLADKLEFLYWKSVKDVLTLEEGRTLLDAARQLRYMANSFTLKANFVPSNLRIKELEAACAAKDKALRGWMAYFQSDIPKNSDEQESAGEAFTVAWFDMEKALANTCGEGWKSPEDVALLKEQIRVADVAFQSLHERHTQLETNLNEVERRVEVKLLGEGWHSPEKYAKLEAEAGAMREAIKPVVFFLTDYLKHFNHPGGSRIRSDLIEACEGKAGQSLLDELERYRVALHYCKSHEHDGGSDESGSHYSDSCSVCKTIDQVLQQKGEK